MKQTWARFDLKNCPANEKFARAGLAFCSVFTALHNLAQSVVSAGRKAGEEAIVSALFTWLLSSIVLFACSMS